MKLAIYVLLMSFGMQANAAIKISCVSESGAVRINGNVAKKSANLTITDPKNTLGIHDADPATKAPFDVVIRKDESKYTFAKYYCDYNAWDGITFALPKQIVAGSPNKFLSHLTVYSDNGDQMVPVSSLTLTCTPSGN